MNWLHKISQIQDEDLSQELADLNDDIVSRYTTEEAKHNAIDIPGQTCPDIDSVIKAITNIEKVCMRADRMYDTVEQVINDIDPELYGLINTMEELRSCNENLRNLGIYWYEAYKELDEEAKNWQSRASYCYEELQKRNQNPRPPFVD